MRRRRALSGAAMYKGDEETWWITGGSDGTLTDTTEIFNATQNDFNYDIDLPKAMYYHNLANVNETHMVLQGGRDESWEIYINER